MASLNKVQIIGHLGRDPEIRSFSNGGKVASLRVATSESWKDKASGERKERTEWHSVAIHADHAVNFAEKYLRKGSLVYVEGKLETRKWQDQGGNDRYSTEITVRPYGGELQSLDKRESGGGGGGRSDDSRDDRGRDSGSSGGGYGGGGRPSNSDMDDEIPFALEWR
jgi:single-strand DNA-binding protein